jgi:thiamine transport system ATP-binding protein
MMVDPHMIRGLSLRDVGVRFARLNAVREVSFDLPSGEVLAVLGPSGCGKSTLLRAIAGLESTDTGAISFDGADLAGVPTHRRGFALMFQEGQLFSHLTVSGNVGYPLRLRRTPQGERQRRVDELLELVGLSGYAAREPATLSGGESQRVALARALAVSPRLLLLDEPLSALDGGLRERLAADLRKILLATRTTALFVTHDHDEAFAVADRLAVMHEGRVTQVGPIAEVWEHPVDEVTALTLGYARVYSGTTASLIAAIAGIGRRSQAGPVLASSNRAATSTASMSVALRRSALVVDKDGPLHGVVRTVRPTPDRLRLVVEVPGLGEVDAVAPSTRGLNTSALPAGTAVRLSVDATRLALIEKSLH